MVEVRLLYHHHHITQYISHMFADTSVTYHTNINTKVHKLLVCNYGWYVQKYSNIIIPSIVQHRAISYNIPPLPPIYLTVRASCLKVCIRVTRLLTHSIANTPFHVHASKVPCLADQTVYQSSFSDCS